MGSTQRFRSRRTGVSVLAAVLAAGTGAIGALADDAVRGYRIEEWKILANDSLVIRTNDGKHYRATLMGRCIGLKFTDTIAFVTRGERSVDRYAGIMLPDGSRCYFKTFGAIPSPPDSPEAPLTAPTDRRPPATPSR